MGDSKTLLKLNIDVRPVRQAGDQFLIPDVNYARTSKVTPKYQVGACYTSSEIGYHKSFEIQCDDADTVLYIRDDLQYYKNQLRDRMYSTPTGMTSKNGKEYQIRHLIDHVQTISAARKKDQLPKSFLRISPYSIMIKLTIQHIVPKDVKVPYPERYRETDVAYVSKQQVMELRVPVVPQLDSKKSIQDIFNNVVSAIADRYKPEVTRDKARSSDSAITDMIGQDRMNQLKGIAQEVQESKAKQNEKDFEYSLKSISEEDVEMTTSLFSISSEDDEDYL